MMHEYFDHTNIDQNVDLNVIFHIRPCMLGFILQILSITRRATAQVWAFHKAQSKTYKRILRE